ncbi:hypothetical protein INR49_017906 [Caranx melampygus]|nr:hypothetical protein INR49_017906 [Caranx melampygus]
MMKVESASEHTATETHKMQDGDQEETPASTSSTSYRPDGATDVIMASLTSWERDVYNGPEMCDLSGARTVKDACAPHLASRCSSAKTGSLKLPVRRSSCHSARAASSRCQGACGASRRG